MKTNLNRLLIAAAVTGLFAGASLVTNAQATAAENDATAKDVNEGKHACKGMNSCKGQGGGSAEEKGKNACKGHGGCKVG